MSLLLMEDMILVNHNTISEVRPVTAEYFYRENFVQLKYTHSFVVLAK